MNLINNQIFYNLESYLDMNSFDKLNDKIAYTLAKNYHHFRPSGTSQDTLYDQSTISVFKKRDQLIKEIPTLSAPEALFYSKLLGTVTLGTNFVLRGNIGYPATYNKKHLRETALINSFDKQFQFLFDWIDSQNCFSEYGRVIFWINEPNQKTAFHRDYPPNLVQHKDTRDTFIWLTGIVPKQLVILDPETYESHYSNTRACVFDSHNVHSSQGNPLHAAWSLRIDGKFNKDWAEKAGIADYYNV